MGVRRSPAREEVYVETLGLSTSDSLLPFFVGTGTGVVVGAANEAIYVPVIVHRRMTVVGAFYVMGGTVTGVANIDIGLYDAKKNRLTSTGSTACPTTGANTRVGIDCADVTIDPGVYYIALVCSATTNRQFYAHSTVAGFPGSCGVLAEGSALPLPATATWTVSIRAAVPLFGFYTRTESA